jgi:hypothetical protein
MAFGKSSKQQSSQGANDKPECHRSPNGSHRWVNLIGGRHGDVHASPGDWIIRGVQGEFYPCKPDIFAATYEPVK